MDKNRKQVSYPSTSGLSENNICSKCKENKTENIYHFGMSYPSYNLPRAALVTKITHLIPNFSSLGKKVQFNTNNNINDGRNVPIMLAMLTYILSTKGYEKRP